MNQKTEPKEVYVIDKFRVPSMVLNEFLKQTKHNLDFIKTIPGCTQQTILKKEIGAEIVVLTIVVWETEEKLSEAKTKVQAEHKRLGFHPAEFLKRLPPRLRELPNNFISCDYMPGRRLAAIADLLIHHGGYGSCQQSIVAGKPSLILPTFSERESNARRMVAQGLAEMVAPDISKSGRLSFNASEVKDKIQTLLNDSRYRERALKAAAELNTFGGSNRAIKLINDYINNGVDR